MYDLSRFVEKYQLAKDASLKTQPQSGLYGLEIEWNLLDSKFQPLLTGGSGPTRQSFVDYLRSECLSPRLREYSQLEVFHWMIEWATRPYYGPQAAVYEARLMEASLINALFTAGQQSKERLFMWHGNLPINLPVNYDSIPGSWHLAKRRYLERCVQLYGESLATTGTHTNLSLPDALFEWDYMQLPARDRTGGHAPPLYLDEYKSQFYITATRLMRAFAALFIATSASTPFRAGNDGDAKVVYLTGCDSIRNLTFPNPAPLDLPDLYRSLNDYLRLSYDLVRRGIRFGNNNWTPVRARSFAEPVERLIELTSEQIQDLYARGLFVPGEDQPLDDLANQIEIQNMLARINIPMARVEIRTDDGGNPIEVEIANLTLKHLLLLRIYADPDFARSFRYDHEDIARARRNEELAARHGLRAEIENPLSGKPVTMRSFLEWTVTEVKPLAEALEMGDALEPILAMASGKPNTAEMLRNRTYDELGIVNLGEDRNHPVPLEFLQVLAGERESQVEGEVAKIAETHSTLGEDGLKLAEFLEYAREGVHQKHEPPIRFGPLPGALFEILHPDKTSEIVALAKQLIEIPSVTACPEERIDEVHRAAALIYEYLRRHGAGVRFFDEAKYPAILAGFPGRILAPVMLSGHFDVVEPEPDDGQFIPRVEGDYLWGRGAADMKTVVATYLVWLKDRLKANEDYPPIALLLVGNEENGEGEPTGTPHVLGHSELDGFSPGILIAGERTGETGGELWGEICTKNRGVMRFDVSARGKRGHTGVSGKRADLVQVLFDARLAIINILQSHLTLTSSDGWQSQINFSFLQAGTPGVYNISPDYARMGVEVRPIPEDDLEALTKELEAYCEPENLQLEISVRENGVVCNPQNPYLETLIRAVRKASGSEPTIGRKLPGTSARFAPGGQGVVWGQSGSGPHSSEERHYIPSILPYYNALNEYAALLQEL